ncbi:TPA: abortive infection system antitoxin AbiGi family protein, partial [Vibrio diabolicus]
NNQEYVMYVPMVSFCDIPLSQIKDHIKKYGKYGIGLTKTWAEQSKLNPVLYIEKQSNISQCLDLAYDKLVYDIEGNIDQLPKANRCFYDVFRHIKNYEADLIRKNTVHKNYRFYDEREWRFVPSTCEDCLMVMGEEIFNSPKNNPLRLKAMQKIKNQILKFDIRDIKYLIVKDESDINTLVQHLKRTKGNISYDEMDKLLTRVLTAEQIHTDL